jgi:hypothetical protein
MAYSSIPNTVGVDVSSIAALPVKLNKVSALTELVLSNWQSSAVPSPPNRRGPASANNGPNGPFFGNRQQWLEAVFPKILSFYTHPAH